MSNQRQQSKSNLFTQRSMEKMESPDQLKDYLKVTTAPVWAVLIAVFILLAGFFAWSAFATLASYTSSEGTVKDGVLSVTLSEEDEDATAEKETGERMCRIGELETVLTVSGRDSKGNRIATGQVSLPDGIYDVRIGYRQTKAIELLLN